MAVFDKFLGMSAGKVGTLVTDEFIQAQALLFNPELKSIYGYSPLIGY
jgi:hypothetical protein